jgi:hypothetical protein
MKDCATFDWGIYADHPLKAEFLSALLIQPDCIAILLSHQRNESLDVEEYIKNNFADTTQERIRNLPDVERDNYIRQLSKNLSEIKRDLLSHAFYVIEVDSVLHPRYEKEFKRFDQGVSYPSEIGNLRYVNLGNQYLFPTGNNSGVIWMEPNYVKDAECLGYNKSWTCFTLFRPTYSRPPEVSNDIFACEALLNVFVCKNKVIAVTPSQFQMDMPVKNDLENYLRVLQDFDKNGMDFHLGGVNLRTANACLEDIKTINADRSLELFDKHLIIESLLTIDNCNRARFQLFLDALHARSPFSGRGYQSDSIKFYIISLDSVSGTFKAKLEWGIKNGLEMLSGRLSADPLSPFLEIDEVKKAKNAKREIEPGTILRFGGNRLESDDGSYNSKNIVIMSLENK